MTYPDEITKSDTLTKTSMASPLLYQSESLNNYAKQLIYGFTRKPLSLNKTNDRQKLSQEMGLEYEKLIVPEQVHRNSIKDSDETDFSACDAIILKENKRPALIQTADCAPVLLYSPEQHIGAVIHAGWRGTAKSITAKTVYKMQTEFKCSPQHIIAVIGPAITGHHYEVSNDVAAALREALPEHVPTESYQSLSPNKKPCVDLKTINAYQLKSVGVHQIDILPFCTVGDNDKFWSHRQGESGRQGLFLQLTDRWNRP